MKNGIAGVCVVLTLTGVVPLGAQSASAPNPLQEPCPASTCGGDCRNTPFTPTNCMTTPYGPARANVVIGNPLTSPNMLWCPGGRPYALCFFSGPSQPTGKPPAPGQPPNNALPCTYDTANGVANCSCQVYNTGSYYVDINSILNRGVWYETRYACGADGSRCRNLRDCDENGQTKNGAEFACSPLIAPVCGYINSQGTGEPAHWFYPEAGTADLVSTFSFAMSPTPTDGPYVLGSTPCSGLYAGCMTAPCRYQNGAKSASDGSIVQCACPLWNGCYQVGQNAQTCPLSAPYVWSAANSVSLTTTAQACPSSATATK